MGRSVLILDDDAEMGDFVCAAAETLGFHCTATTTRADFFHALASGTPVILLDLLMPETDGVEILRLLARDNCRCGIVFMSGVGKRVVETARELARTLGLNVAGHLQKPFGIQELAAVLESAHSATLAGLGDMHKQITLSDSDLRTAIEREEFILHYQPQIEIATGKLVGAEALVRWQHPDGLLLPPDSFIARAETLGLMERLGWLVARRALAEIEQFADPQGEIPGIAINVSVSALLDLDFPDTLARLARSLRVPNQKVTIEITESGLLEELSKSLDVLTRLRMKSFQISIDDFGTGYATLQQLRLIPATELKIDRSFIRNLYHSIDDRIIVQKTIEIGHDLGLKVVGEGIETQHQLEFLRQHQCDAAQGFLFTPALPTTSAVPWFGQYRARSAPTGETGMQG